tara:strand:- start:768 stop:1196 length:429 start_codon:yes stop_codon:yes gene_type:complete
MSKRQVENTIWEEVWFMDLDLHYKVLILYFFTTSNHAGLGNLNFKIINTVIGYDYKKDDVLLKLKEHLREYKEGKYQLIKFMKFHYTEGNNSNQFKNAVKLLRSEGLWDEMQDRVLTHDEQEAYDKAINNGIVSKKFLKTIR